MDEGKQEVLRELHRHQNGFRKLQRKSQKGHVEVGSTLHVDIPVINYGGLGKGGNVAHHNHLPFRRYSFS